MKKAKKICMDCGKRLRWWKSMEESGSRRCTLCMLNYYRQKYLELRKERMEMKIKLKETGRKFESNLVENGHKRGVLCLSCGVYADGLICEDCKKFKECKMCGIVCKPIHQFKLYTYLKNKGVSTEVYQEVEPFCQSLNEEGFCNDCSGWESRMKDTCYSCGNLFGNSFKHFRECGNLCRRCMADVAARMKIIDKDRNLK